MKKKNSIWLYTLLLMGMLLILTSSCKKDTIITPTPTYETGMVTDTDGNVYKTVKIGDQWWMAENLKTTKFNDGKAIPLVTDNIAWNKLTTAGYCWYNNDSTTNKSIYGTLYNWYTVNTGKLCPIGWHVPSDAEWKTLITYLGGISVAGGKMKEKDFFHWESPNTGATNSSRFTALPGGSRNDAYSFFDIGYSSHWWFSTEYDASNAWCINLNFVSENINILNYNKNFGFYVRCLKD